MDLVTVILATCAVAGLYVAWNVGANVVPNVVGLGIGTSALNLRTALLIATVFEVAGAMLAGPTVSETIGSGLIGVSALGEDAKWIAPGMTASLISASIWLHVAARFDWPVSTTHSIVGSVLGLGFWLSGGSDVEWPLVGTVLLSWLLSPILAGVLAFYIFATIRRRILAVRNPDHSMAVVSPVVVFVILFVLTLAVCVDGSPSLGLDLRLRQALPLAFVCGAAAAMGVAVYGRRSFHPGSRTERVERRFALLQAGSVALLAFAHGSNDVANAVGPMSAVFDAVSQDVQGITPVPLNVLVIGAFGIVLGLTTQGANVMATLGQRISELTPSRGFAAELAAAATIIGCSKAGLPVSTTHTLIGAIIGVGMARAISAMDLHVLRGVFATLLFTVPVTAALTALLMGGVDLLM